MLLRYYVFQARSKACFLVSLVLLNMYLVSGFVTWPVSQWSRLLSFTIVYYRCHFSN